MNRIERINSEMQKLIASIIAEEINNPKIKSGLISVIKVDTTADLKQSKVYISVVGNDEKAIFDSIVQAGGFIRSSLSKKLDIRTIPELIFICDNSIEYAAHISKLIDDIHKKENSK